jgi:hypothetical protein
MAQKAEIRGAVLYRLGDGPLQPVPLGEIEVEAGPQDVTLSWGDNDTRQSTAMPASDFARYLAAGAIVCAAQDAS